MSRYERLETKQRILSSTHQTRCCLPRHYLSPDSPGIFEKSSQVQASLSKVSRPNYWMRATKPDQHPPLSIRVGDKPPKNPSQREQYFSQQILFWAPADSFVIFRRTMNF